MAEFLVELYVAARDGDRTARQLAVRARAAAAELTRDGSPVRCLGSVFVADDETCLQLYEAPSAEVVREVVQRAGGHCEHVAPATSS